LIVRSARGEDAPRVASLAGSVFHLACPPDTPSDEIARYLREALSIESIVDTINSPVHQVRIVEVAGELAGFSVVSRDPPSLGITTADGIPELTRCYVAAAYHGSGAARVLLRHTLSDITGAMRLMVNDHNARAIRFYQRHGFITVGETSFQCGDDMHRDIVMVRSAG